jgi:hypothetical protein
MRQLSVEVFGEVFQYAVEEEYRDLMEQLMIKDLPAQKHLPTVAFTIAATCRHWREIATAMPKLWRYICAPWAAAVQLKRGSVQTIVGQARFKRCLALAGNTNLHLTVRGVQLSCWKPILGDEGTREWTRVNILDVPNIPSLLPSAPKVVLYSKSDFNLTVNLPITLLSSAEYLICRSVLPHVGMSISRLRQLNISLANKQVTCPNLGALLISLPILKRLWLRCDGNIDFQWVGNRTARSHSSLQSLRFMTCFALYLAFELRFLSLPSLNELRILDIHIPFNPERASRLLASPIADTVTSLWVRCTELMKAREIRMLVGGFPNLTTLVLEESAVFYGLETLLETNVPDKLEKVTLGSYEEEGVNELIERLRSESPRLNIRFPR